MPSMSGNRTLVQIRDAAQSVGYFGRKTVLDQTIENLSNLSSVQAMIRLEGSPFTDLQALIAQYPEDSFISPYNAEFVIIGTDLFFIRNDMDGSVQVPGWTNRSLSEFATVDADVTGLQSSISSLSGQVNVIQSSLNDEITRAQTAENQLSDNLQNGLVQANQANQLVQSSLNDEIVRAQQAEATLSGRSDLLESNVSALQSGLADEIVRAQTAEQAIAGDVEILTEIVDAIVPNNGGSSHQA